MKLEDICNNKRFAKGELYGSKDYLDFYRIPSEFTNHYIWRHNSQGVIESVSGQNSECTGLSIHDFNSDNWKLYEFKDGKMVEYVENNTMGCSDAKIRLDPLDVWRVWPPVEAKMVEVEEEKPSITKIFNDTITEVLSNMTEQDWEKEAEQKGLSGDKAKAYVKHMYGSCRSEDETKHGQSENIMQPIEAIRWMRENPGKVIVAVEDENIRCYYDVGTDTFYLQRYPNGNFLSTNISMIFLAYTYKVLEE